MNCPDVCPATMMQLKHAYDQIQTNASAMPLHQVVFISVDGKRDTPAKLADYVSYFNASFIGATGTPGQITGITKQLDAFYRIKNTVKDNAYEVVHSADLFVIDPRGRVVDRISPPFDIHALVNEYKALTGEADALVLNNSSSLLRYGIK
jgi:protein SCO1/2